MCHHQEDFVSSLANSRHFENLRSETHPLLPKTAMLSRSCIAASRRRVVGGVRRRPTTTNSSTAQAPSPPSSSSFLQNPLQWYAAKLDTHPLITKCISSGFIAGSGDRLCQYLAAKKKEDDNNNLQPSSSYDWKRTLRFATLGCFFTAPTIHVWYGFLMSRFPGTGISTIIKRLVCDQGFLSPLFLPTFVSCLTVLEHFTSDEKEGGTIDDGSTGSNNNTLDNNPRNNNHDDDLYSRLQTSENRGSG